MQIHYDSSNLCSSIRTSKIRLLLFEDVIMKNPIIKIYKFHSGNINQIGISKILYGEVKIMKMSK